MDKDLWNAWNEQDGPKYPHEKVIQFCFRKYATEHRSDTRTLDLGCGSGVHTVFLASEGFQVTATDISKQGLANTQQRLDKHGLQAILREESADVIDFPPSSFDLVICVGVFDAVGPTIAHSSIAKLSDVMSSGGYGLFLFASDRDFRVQEQDENIYRLHGYSVGEVESMFAQDFNQVWIDRYITTYQGGLIEQNDWLVTVER